MPRSSSATWPASTGWCIGSRRRPALTWSSRVADEHGLTRAAVSWLAQPHPTWNVVLAAHPDVLVAATTTLTTAGIAASRITTIPTDPATTPAAALAAAADAATSEHLLLMQTPAMGLTHDWLTRLIGYSRQPGIAAAGPVVLGPDGRIQQAGIAIPDGIPLPLHHGSRAGVGAARRWSMNVSAVSGVLATRRRDLPAARRPEPRTSATSPRSTTACAPPTPASASSSSPTPGCRPPALTPPPTISPASGSCARPGPKPTPTTPTTTPTTAPTAATSSRASERAQGGGNAPAMQLRGALHQRARGQSGSRIDGRAAPETSPTRLVGPAPAGQAGRASRARRCGTRGRSPPSPSGARRWRTRPAHAGGRSGSGRENGCSSRGAAGLDPSRG